MCLKSDALVAALRKAALVLLLPFGLMWVSPPAFAYRPFDGTDVAVADPGDLEIEFQLVFKRMSLQEVDRWAAQ